MMHYILKALLVATLCTLMFTGCATTQNLLSREHYIKKTVPHPKTSFRQIWAVADDGEFRVSGKLRMKGTMGTHIPEYVKVDLVDKDGAIIETQKVGYTPRVLSGRPRHREARFIARFSETPSPGITIQLSNVN
jgi:hypothetical protein